MTTTTRGTMPPIGAHLDGVEAGSRTAWLTVLILAALLLPTSLAYSIDERLIAGASVWAKPLKFELSLALHMATLALLVGVLTPIVRASRTVRWSALAIAFAAIGEIMYICLQASRGRASHFNNSTPVEGFAYGLMGIGSLVLVIGPLIIGIMIWRQGRPATGAGLHLGASLGLILGCVATLITAGVLSSSPTGHWIGSVQSDANSLPLFGWSTTGGDLRVAHFFATHAMQGLPIVGLLADRLFPAAARGAVLVATLVWALIVIATFLQALSGQPLVRL
jgi:hypothetical protein